MKTEHLRARWKWRGFQAHFIFRREVPFKIKWFKTGKVGGRATQMFQRGIYLFIKNHRWILQSSFWVILGVAHLCSEGSFLKGHFSRYISCFGDLDAVSKHAEKKTEPFRTSLKNPVGNGLADVRPCTMRSVP